MTYALSTSLLVRSPPPLPIILFPNNNLAICRGGKRRLVGRVLQSCRGATARCIPPFQQRARPCMLPFKLGPRLANIVLRDKHCTEARLFLIHFCKVGNQIFAEEFYALEQPNQTEFRLCL